MFHISLNSSLQRLGLVRDIVPGFSALSRHWDSDTPRLILFAGNSVKRENRLAPQDEITEITDWVQITRENSLASLCAGRGEWLKKETGFYYFLICIQFPVELNGLFWIRLSEMIATGAFDV